MLAFGADFRDQQVAAVALALLRRHRARHDDVEARLLPGVEAAGQILDVGVAELLHGAGGEQRAGAGLAVQSDRRVVVAHHILDAQLEIALAEMNRVGNVPGFELVALADVDQDALAAAQPLGGGFGDGLPGVSDKLAKRPRHDLSLSKTRLN